MIDRAIIHNNFLITPFFFKKVETEIRFADKFEIFKKEILENSENIKGEPAFWDDLHTITIKGIECYIFYTETYYSGKAYLFQKQYLNEIGFDIENEDIFFEDFSFKINTDKHILYVYQDDNLIGGVMECKSQTININITRKNGYGYDN